MTSRASVLLGIACAALLAGAGSASASVTTTVRFDYTGAAQTFTAPAGVSVIHVVAIGGRGGYNAALTRAGGNPAILSADLPVSAGALTVMVGGNGADGSGFTGGAGGFNGGGAGGAGAGNGIGGGGGGGASDVRTGAGLASRLLVAAGGGGAGGDYAPSNPGGLAGDADSIGGAGNGLTPGGGGGSGTTVGGGAGGTAWASDCGLPGVDGALGVGGAGGGQQGAGSGGSGGGGGGEFGGGGGASGCNGSSGGGGGGGASFVTATALHATPLPPPLDSSGIPSVTISYTSAGPAASVSPGSLAFAAQPQGTVSAPQGVGITNTGAAPLHVQGVTITGIGAADYLVDASSCIGAVAPAAGCSVAVRFAPHTTGALGATMHFADDTGTPHNVALSGTGTALPSGPSGPIGPAGPGGSTGPSGAPGPPGPVTRSLAVLIGTGSFSATAGSSLTVPFAASLPAIVTLELRKGNRIVVRTQASVRAGRGKLKIAHLPKAAGRYTVRLTAFAADGETASDHVALTVRAKAKKKPAKQPSGNGNGNGPAVGGGGTS